MSAHLDPDRLTIGQRLGHALLALVLFPIAGVPVVAAIAAESAVIAEVTGWDYDTVLRWQVGPVLVFAGVALVAVVVGILVRGEAPWG